MRGEGSATFDDSSRTGIGELRGRHAFRLAGTLGRPGVGGLARVFGLSCSPWFAGPRGLTGVGGRASVGRAVLGRGLLPVVVLGDG